MSEIDITKSFIKGKNSIDNARYIVRTYVTPPNEWSKMVYGALHMFYFEYNQLIKLIKANKINENDVAQFYRIKSLMGYDMLDYQFNITKDDNEEDYDTFPVDEDHPANAHVIIPTIESVGAMIELANKELTIRSGVDDNTLNIKVILQMLASKGMDIVPDCVYDHGVYSNIDMAEKTQREIQNKFISFEPELRDMLETRIIKIGEPDTNNTYIHTCDKRPLMTAEDSVVNRIVANNNMYHESVDKSLEIQKNIH